VIYAIFIYGSHAHLLKCSSLIEIGVQISMHTEAGRMGLEQVELFHSEGMQREWILIKHMYRKMNFEYLLAMMKTAVTIEL
jgi:predicted metal-dependent phosphotriesterase family hydrolase